MRLSLFRAGVVATVAATALAACASHGIVPSSTGGADAAALNDGSVVPLKLTTCATSPPQAEWIFDGACVKIALTAAGEKFSLPAYDDITITGSIGKNDTKGTATIYLADATDTKGDIKEYGGKAFPVYKADGKTFVYAAAVNQSTQTIKPVAEKGKPILQYVITDSVKLPGTTCGAAVLTETAQKKLVWSALPGTFPAKGKTVTITQYNVPKGFELPPKTPLYFAVNCFS